MTPGRLSGEPLQFVPPEIRPGVSFAAMHEYSHDYGAGAEYFLGDDRKPVSAGPWEPDAQTELALEFLRERKRQDEPFFLTVSYGPPHDPYAPPEALDRYKASDVALRPNVPRTRRKLAKDTLARYYGLVSAVDLCIGRLLDGLEELGLDGDTLVVLTSDHGDMLYSHNQLRKRRPWEESIGTPSVWRLPGVIPSGEVSRLLLSSADLMPTLLALCAVEPPEARVDGTDLSDALMAGTKAEDSVESVYLQIIQSDNTPHGAPWRGIVTADGWKWAGSSQVPDWVLYDLGEDPYEQRNLIEDPQHSSRRAELEAAARDVAQRLGDPFFR